MPSELAPPTRRSGAAVVEAIHQLVARALVGRDGKCSDVDGVNACEKPAISSQSVTWVIVGVVLGVFVVGGLSTLLFLHLKNKRRNKREDLEDRFQMSDYGLDEVPQQTGKGRQVMPEGRPKLSLDDTLGTDGRSSDGIRSQKRASGLPRGYVNPFVSPVDDSASIKSIDLNPKWPSRSDSPASSQNPLPQKI